MDTFKFEPNKYLQKIDKPKYLYDNLYIALMEHILYETAKYKRSQSMEYYAGGFIRLELLISSEVNKHDRKWKDWKCKGEPRAILIHEQSHVRYSMTAIYNCRSM